MPSDLVCFLQSEVAQLLTWEQMCGVIAARRDLDQPLTDEEWQRVGTSLTGGEALVLR